MLGEYVLSPFKTFIYFSFLKKRLQEFLSGGNRKEILLIRINQIPNYLNILLEMGTIKGLIIISIGIMIINLIIVIAQYIRERITTVFTLKISSNLFW